MHCDYAVHFSADFGFIGLVQCSGHRDIKACPPNSRRLFQFHMEERCGIDMQTRRDTSRTVQDGG